MILLYLTIINIVGIFIIYFLIGIICIEFFYNYVLNTI